MVEFSTQIARGKEEENGERWEGESLQAAG